jgi:hypothetical protein
MDHDELLKRLKFKLKSLHRNGIYGQNAVDNLEALEDHADSIWAAFIAALEDGRLENDPDGVKMDKLRGVINKGLNKVRVGFSQADGSLYAYANPNPAKKA